MANYEELAQVEALKQIPHKSLKTEISKPKRVVEKKNTYYEEFFNFGMEDFKWNVLNVAKTWKRNR